MLKTKIENNVFYCVRFLTDWLKPVKTRVVALSGVERKKKNSLRWQEFKMHVAYCDVSPKRKSKRNNLRKRKRAWRVLSCMILLFRTRRFFFRAQSPGACSQALSKLSPLFCFVSLFSCLSLLCDPQPGELFVRASFTVLG